MDHQCRERIVNIILTSFIASDLLCACLRLPRDLIEKIVRGKLRHYEELGGLVLLAGFASSQTQPYDAHNLLEIVEAVHICIAGSASIAESVRDPTYELIEHFFESIVPKKGSEEKALVTIPLQSFMIGVLPSGTEHEGSHYRQNNIRYTLALEKETIARARRNGFSSIETVNVSPLTLVSFTVESDAKE